MTEISAELQELRIENTRLNAEAEEHARALAQSLEQQTAMAQVLNIIASSPTELPPVLDAICTTAARVCGAPYASIRLAEGDRAVIAADFTPLAAHEEPVPIAPGAGAWRAIR